MKKTLGILLCLLALMICAGAAADVAINETNFPDANFRQYIRDQGFDANGDGKLSDAELATVESIGCQSYGIKSLKGIEYFTEMYALGCSYNQLTSLDVSGNPKLLFLDCYENQLAHLDLSQNPDLTELYCSSNQLTELDVSNNPSLVYFQCDQNRLTSLDVRQNSRLEELVCFGNQLTSLQLGKHPKLSYLHCFDNRLTSLDVSQCKRIRRSVQKGPDRDCGTYWEYGASDDGPSIAFIDKSVRITLGNGEVVEPSPITLTVGALKYELSDSTATVTGAKSKNAKTLTIPETIPFRGADYKVTAIKASAFKDMKKLTKVTIGANVKSIGKNAFYNCKKLKTIDIKTKLLTSKNVKTNAFKGIYKKATIKCPSGKKAAYKKWLTKRGVPKTAKIK